MKEEKLGQEPCYPTTITHNIGHLSVQYAGMSKRFYAACAAMQGILANSELAHHVGIESSERNISSESFIIGMAYEMADELLKQETL